MTRLQEAEALLRRWCQFAGSNWTDGNLERATRAFLDASPPQREPTLPRDHYIREALEEMTTVPRGHCDRCDRCGWEFGRGRPAPQCRPGNCSMRPLPELRSTCAGCGAPYATPPKSEPTGRFLCVNQFGCQQETVCKHVCALYRPTPVTTNE